MNQNANPDTLDVDYLKQLQLESMKRVYGDQFDDSNLPARRLFIENINNIKSRQQE